MEEAELEKKRHMVTKSSIKRKPLANLTNIIRKPNHTYSFSQSKKPGSSTASESSVGTTQSLIHVVPSTPQKLTHDHLGGDENHITYSRRGSAQKTRSNVKAAVQETSSNVKGNQSCLDKTTNNGKEKSMVLQCSSMEKIKDKRKAIDVPSIAHRMKNVKTTMNVLIPHSTKIKDKGKENDVQSNDSSMDNTSINTSFIMPPLLKRKDKGKAIVDYDFMKKLKNNMVEVRVPLSGVKIKDRGETVMGSSRVDLAQKDEGKAVATPINYRILEKKDKRSSCPPLSRTTGNSRNEADEGEDIYKSNPQTDPPLNKKKKRCSSTKDVEKYVLPKDFVEQQRAYFKEIDEFELEVEEV